MNAPRDNGGGAEGRAELARVRNSPAASECRIISPHEASKGSQSLSEAEITELIRQSQEREQGQEQEQESPQAPDPLQAGIDKIIEEGTKDSTAPSPWDQASAPAPSPSSVLAEIAKLATLWHSPQGEPFASVPVKGHRENYPVESADFRKWFQGAFWRRTKSPVPETPLNNLIAALSAEARFSDQEFQTAVRLGGGGSGAEESSPTSSPARSLFIDLGGPDWRCVEIGPEGWGLCAAPPIKFLRPTGLQALPTPQEGTGAEAITLLRPFVNVESEADFHLLVGFLLACLAPRGPYPILALAGQEGSAKSTLARVIRALIDPNALTLRPLPRKEQDFLIAAKNGHLLCFDNLSFMPPWIADTLCRISTGGGFATRQLYTDTDEIIWQVTRPIVLNGIPDLLERSDLASRSIALTIPQIRKLRTEADFWAEFHSASPLILGGLFAALSAALRHQGSISIPSLPRMADMACWITAAESALPWPEGTFLRAYEANRAQLREIAIEADPVAQRIRNFARNRGPRLWTGTATELERQLLISSSPPPLWPRGTNNLSNRIRRVAPALHSIGISVEQRREGGTGRRLIEIGLRGA